MLNNDGFFQFDRTSDWAEPSTIAFQFTGDCNRLLGKPLEVPSPALRLRNGLKAEKDQKCGPCLLSTKITDAASNVRKDQDEKHLSLPLKEKVVSYLSMQLECSTQESLHHYAIFRAIA